MAPYTLPGIFAQSSYGEGAYGSQLYGQDSSSGLTDTGMPVLLGGAIGVVLIIGAVILFVKARRRP